MPSVTSMPSVPSFSTLVWGICHPDIPAKEFDVYPRIEGSVDSQKCTSHVEFSHSSTIARNDKKSEDTVVPLPPTWPIMPQLFRRRSCEMMTIMGPCVQKAVSHLEMVQDLIEQWFRNSEMLAEPTAVEEEDRTVCHSVSREPSEQEWVEDSYSRMSLVSTCEDSSPIQPEAKPDSVADTENDTVLANIGAEDVIEEVMTLLARLEKDRQDTEFAYITECDTVTTLNAQVVEKARTRLVELAIRIQSEHEACILDMNELQWHVNYSERMRDRILSKTKTAEMFNTRLKEDISFVKEHIPLIEEKLDLELSAMEKIGTAQLATNKELEATLTRLAKTESKSTEAQKKADKERDHIAKEIKAVVNKLTELQDELTACKARTVKYEKERDDFTQKIDELTKLHQILDVEHELIRDKEEQQSLLVNKLESEIAEVNFEQDRLANINLTRKTKLANKIKKNTNEINTLEKKVQQSSKTEKRLTKKKKVPTATLR